ncbi:MAG: hypothetical protein HY673_06210 [Chloroflexi bacterium]|nr:hypothetical protein [Chloroflexota bacterium]
MLEDDVLKWLGEKIYSWKDLNATQNTLTAEFSVGAMAPLPFLAKILARMSGHIKTGHAIKQEVRLKLDPQISQFIERVNLFLEKVRIGLRKREYEDLVVIIDNLDRTAFKVLDAASNRTSHDAIYLERADQLKALNVNIVYTVPISMFYSLKATQLTGAFPLHLILPMIKVSNREGSRFEEGRRVLLEVAGRRMEAGAIFDPAVLSYLAEKSGGMIRDFVRLLSYAMEIGLARKRQIPLGEAVARVAFQRLVNEYGRMIPPEHFRLLQDVHLEKRVRNDAEHQAMLFNLSVLEYLNNERWCDVHPAVLELREFKEAAPRKIDTI